MSQVLWVQIAWKVPVKQGNTHSTDWTVKGKCLLPANTPPPPAFCPHLHSGPLTFSEAKNASEFREPHSDYHFLQQAKEHSYFSRSLKFSSTYGYCWASGCEDTQSPRALLSSFQSLPLWKATSMVNLHSKRDMEIQVSGDRTYTAMLSYCTPYTQPQKASSEHSESLQGTSESRCGKKAVRSLLRKNQNHRMAWLGGGP